MSYELKNDQTLGDNLRRICRKQIEAAIAVAADEKKASDTPVHEVRKHLKKARAALRLIRKEIGHGLFREQDRCLRNVGRLTSEIRDAEVRLQAVRQLQGITQRRRRGAYAKLEGMLMLELENFMAAFAEWQTQAVPLLERALANVDCFFFSSRRRHTIFDCDWSSDVCSSDLRLSVFEFFRGMVFHFDHVIAELRFHRLADLAWIQFERSFLERWNHAAARKRTEDRKSVV